jgi:hypothetical protein
MCGVTSAPRELAGSDLVYRREEAGAEQADSIYAALKKDDRLATILAIELKALKSRHACYAHD